MLNKKSAEPLYMQLVDVLTDDIDNKLQANEKMLSERQICEQYDVSRTTVRLALAELENMGYIYKRHGKGTFVSAPSRRRQNLSDSYSFTEQTLRMHQTPATKVLSFRVMPSNQFISNKMALGEGEDVYRVKRLRLADEVPMMVEITYIPVKYFAGLTKEMIMQQPLYNIFNSEYGQNVVIADEEFSAGIASDEEAMLLEVEPHSACLRLQRTSYNQDDRIIEFTLSTARSDQFVYRVRHVK